MQHSALQLVLWQLCAQRHIGRGRHGRASSQRYLVIAILNSKHRSPENAHLGFALIGFRQPEVADFLVLTFEVSPDGPPGRVYSWFTFDSGNGEVFAVHPDSSSKQKFILTTRRCIEHVELFRVSLLVSTELKNIVLGRDGRTLLIIISHRLLFRLKEFLEDTVAHRAGAAL